MKIEILSAKISTLHYFENHPIRIRKNDKYYQLLSCIKENGLLEPIKVRKAKSGYEVIDGRLRVEIHKDLELKTIPSMIEEKDDDTALVHLLDSNLRRDDVLPSELGFLFRMRLEAMNRQGKRTDLTCDSELHKLKKGDKTREVLGKLVGKSGATVSKYIRLTYLTPLLLELIDSRKLPLIAGADLSYLEVEQEWVARLIEKHRAIPTTEQSKQIKEAFNKGKLTLALLDRIMLVKDLYKPKKLVFEYSVFAPYFPKNTPPQQMKEEIIKVISRWKNNRE